MTGYDVEWSADGSTGVGRRSATGSRDRRPSRPTACPRRPRTGVTQWRWGLSLSPPGAGPALNCIELLHIAAEGYALNGTEDYGAAIGRHGTARPMRGTIVRGVRHGDAPALSVWAASSPVRATIPSARAVLP